ncbi:putative uncharacterized protein [Clostridium sp. CAG:710]|nr:putative uncharacterized protein [Clostridium sp. CAG:710]
MCNIYNRSNRKGEKSTRENKIILFENQEVKLEVNMKDETVWLSLEQMAELFSRDRTVIARHINNIFKDNELDKNEVCAKFAHTTKHGAISDKSQTRELIYYNLDMIISVGYRVKSKNGIIFRKWATKVLKDYMIKGYAVNQKRLEYLEETIKLIDIAGRMDAELKGSEAWEIIKVINNYSSALSLLDDYDHKRITKPMGTKNDKQVTYEDCMNIIGKLKFNSDSNLFALERNEGLKEIIGTIYQSFDGKDLYSTIEEKAANFLYLITKNHTFIDGNKRIAATLFIYFLEFYNILYNENGQVIDNNTLVAITLLIAQSNPKEKEILIALVMNFLNNK